MPRRSIHAASSISAGMAAKKPCRIHTAKQVEDAVDEDQLVTRLKAGHRGLHIEH
jgi:hypothetical protein